MYSHTYICILNQLLICNREYISRVCSRLELLSAHLTTNFKIPNTTKFQCNKQKLKGLLYIKRPVLSMLTMHLDQRNCQNCNLLFRDALDVNLCYDHICT